MLFAVHAVAMTDTVIWTGLAGLVLIATIAGFVAGVVCAPWLQERSLQRAAKHVQRLIDFTTAQMERTTKLCRLLNTAANTPFEKQQWERLDAARQNFSEAWKGIAERQTVVNQPADATREETSPATPFQMEWIKATVDHETQLPDKAAFETNLKQLITTSSEHGHPSGLLLIKIDKCDQLVRRYGAAAVTVLQSKLASVVIKAARDADLVCRLNQDQFAVLIPSVSPLAGARVAETIRAAVRDHAFRIEADGPEVLLTANFGYAVCLPDEPPVLVVDRASEALQKSQSVGRNQLHVHDATNRVLSRIG